MNATTSTDPGSAAASSEAPALRILIADKFEASGVATLEASGFAVEIDPDLGPDTLPEAIARLRPKVLVVRSTKVRADAIEASDGLELIVRAGAGYDNIDVAAASRRGILVANCPGKNAIAVAELAWSLILSCDRRVPDQTADLRAGVWNKKEYQKAQGLAGRTVGIVGFGQIGREVAKRAKAFGMPVLAWSRSLTEEAAAEAGVGWCESLLNLAKLSDVVSVHVAATPDTERLIGEKFFSQFRPGGIFVNTSRGSVVDEQALAAAVRDKSIRAGLDVFAKEPGGGTGQFEDPLVTLPGVYGTHHVGASTDQAQRAIAAETVRVVEVFDRTGQAPNCVNRAAATPATELLSVRHLNRPGVLAHVFYTIGQAGINVEEMENVIYEGAEAACARIQLDAALDPEHLDAIRANPNVLAVTSVTLSRGQSGAVR
ncbi:MAG: NAD(P)-dependent oxidoreductase [Planctomycetota bacterium]|jgi:D-3-phosphoglycerate dehydrogenase